MEIKILYESFNEERIPFSEILSFEIIGVDPCTYSYMYDTMMVYKELSSLIINFKTSNNLNRVGYDKIISVDVYESRGSFDRLILNGKYDLICDQKIFKINKHDNKSTT